MEKKQEQKGKSTKAKKGNGGSRIYEPKKNVFREVFEILMYGLSLLIFCKGYVWQNFQIPTSSMENTLLIGDHITANTFIFKNSSPLEKKLFPFRDIERGDVVVFKFPGDVRQDWIKRCVGVPGDRFELIGNKVYIDGEPLDEPYPFYKEHAAAGVSNRDPSIRYRPKGYYELKPGINNAERLYYDRLSSTNMSSVLRNTRERLRLYARLDPEIYKQISRRLDEAESDVIPEGFYFMMGDNRNNSSDSRVWGLVPREFIQGKAYWVWWSYGEDEGSHEKKGLDFIWSYLRVPITFWTRTHWEETFSLIR